MASRRERFTANEWLALCAAYGNLCLRCGSGVRRLTADHIVPLARGGGNDITNIQPLCGPCNSRKGTQTIDYRKGIYANEQPNQGSRPAHA